MSAPELTLFLYRWELESMPEYSTTLPTGTTPGKVWHRVEYNLEWSDCSAYQKPTGRHFVGMYGEPETPDADTIPIYWFKVVIREGPQPPGWCKPDWSNFDRWQADRKQMRAEGRV